MQPKLDYLCVNSTKRRYSENQYREHYYSQLGLIYNQPSYQPTKCKSVRGVEWGGGACISTDPKSCSRTPPVIPIWSNESINY